MFLKMASSNLYPSSFASFFSSFFFAASIGIDTTNKQSKIPEYQSKKNNYYICIESIKHG